MYIKPLCGQRILDQVWLEFFHMNGFKQQRLIIAAISGSGPLNLQPVLVCISTHAGQSLFTAGLKLYSNFFSLSRNIHRLQFA